MWRLLWMSHICIHVFNTLFNVWFSLVFIPDPMSIPLPHAQSCSCPVPIPCSRRIFCAAGPTLQVPLSFLHSTFSGSSHYCMSLHSAWSSAKVGCTGRLIKRLNELHVSPMIENEVVDWLQKSFYPRIGWSLNWPWRSSFQSLSSL